MSKLSKAIAAARKLYRTTAKRPGSRGFGMSNPPKVTKKSLATELKAQDEWLAGVEADALAAAEASDDDDVALEAEENLTELEDLDVEEDLGEDNPPPSFGDKFEQPMSLGSVDGKE